MKCEDKIFVNGYCAACGSAFCRIDKRASLPQPLQLPDPPGMEQTQPGIWTRLKEAQARVAELQRELDESARLHGMGSEREARLMARVQELEKEIGCLRRTRAGCDATCAVYIERDQLQDEVDRLSDELQKYQSTSSYEMGQLNANEAAQARVKQLETDLDLIARDRNALVRKIEGLESERDQVQSRVQELERSNEAFRVQLGLAHNEEDDRLADALDECETLRAAGDFWKDQARERKVACLSALAEVKRLKKQIELHDVPEKELYFLSCRMNEKLQADNARLRAVEKAARDLYDNRLGWSDGRNPYAPPHFWDNLGDALAVPASEES